MNIILKKVLVVVEDDNDLRKMLVEALTMILPRDEWDITELSAGVGADIALERTPNIYCALITYNNTRNVGSDGLTFIACVRKNFPHAPIIVIHELEPDHVAKATLAGANALIYKGDVTVALLKHAVEVLGVIP